MIGNLISYRRRLVFCFLILIAFLSTATALAHFQMLLPSTVFVADRSGRQIDLKLMFTHPFDNQMMHMKKPVQFGVKNNGKKKDLMNTLQAVKINSFDAYKSSVSIDRPGDHVFYLEPAPYFEPSEETFIVHYTKVIVNAYGMEQGWDKPVGLKAEILPLTRPYGLWTGNIFTGQVLLNGRPVPGAEVEVEYYNPDNKVKAPHPSFATQAVKADKNGVFSYSMVKKGWWGFAALMSDGKKLKHKGKEYPIELGGLIWINVNDMK